MGDARLMGMNLILRAEEIKPSQAKLESEVIVTAGLKRPENPMGSFL